MNLGLAYSIPLFLISSGATWKDQGTFNFTFYPFSLKLLWAPLIDVLYIERFGRRKSWLVPIQLITGGIFFFLSFYIESLISTNSVVFLTVIFFFIIFLTATEDICIDGLAISLFAMTNPQWASTSQTIGQTLGQFASSSFLLTFESSNFTNRFIRKPLSLPLQSSGLFSLEQFVRFIAVTFLIVTICLIVFLREKQEVLNINGEKTNDFSVTKTYLSIIKLLKKKSIRQLTLVSLLSPIGLVAIQYMTELSLIR
jgi:PAT family acetyl-CoA transporter-like MFS transporter 1